MDASRNSQQSVFVAKVIPALMVAIGIYGIVIWKYFGLRVGTLLGGVGFCVWAAGAFLRHSKATSTTARRLSLALIVVGFCLFAASVVLSLVDL